MSFLTIFSTCVSCVVSRTAPEDYLSPAAFFAGSYPTRRMKELLKPVCLRLSGKGGDVSPIIRLGTQCGGGKTACGAAFASIPWAVLEEPALESVEAGGFLTGKRPSG
jgi:hypothetical protein